MPLLPDVLAKSLLDRWLEPDAGHPATPADSGARFAQAVAEWMTLGMAGPFPCATAMARQGQLAGQAAAALAAGLPPLAGIQLATAVSAYLTGQLFGAGTASAPLATPVVAPLFGAVFSDLASDGATRAERIAAGCHALALSTLVVFPPPLPTLPVL